MSSSNKPEFNEEIEVRLRMSDAVNPEDLLSCPKFEVDSVGALGPGDLLAPVATPSASAVLSGENSEELPNEAVWLPLNLRFPTGYWVAVVCGGLLSVGLLFSCIFLPELGWYLSIAMFGSLGLSSWAYEHIRWRTVAASAIKLGVYQWAEVAIIRQPESIDEESQLHVLINNTLLLPVSEIDSGFNQNLFLEIVRQPVVKRKVFYLPGSDLPVAVATENNYLLLGRSGGSVIIRYAVPLTMIVLLVQTLLFWKFGNVFNFNLIP